MELLAKTWHYLDSLHSINRAIEQHFQHIDPSTITDIDKYLREHGWMI